MRVIDIGNTRRGGREEAADGWARRTIALRGSTHFERTVWEERE